MKHLTARLAVSLASLIVLAGTAEGVLRVFNPLNLDWRMVEHHPVRVEVLTPNFDGYFKGTRVKTNQFGHRIPTSRAKPYDKAKPSDDVTRILIFGDSFAFGDEWPAEDSFAEQLQQQVDPSGSRVQVLNFGVPGYGPFQELHQIREQALGFDPDVVIVQFTDRNDLLDFVPPASTGSLQSLKTWCRRHLYVYSVVWDLWYHGRDSELAQAMRRLVNSSAERPEGTSPLVPPARPSNAALLQQIHAQASEYYQERQAMIETGAAGWRQAYTSYRDVAQFLAAREIPLILLVLAPSWDLACRRWRCQGVGISYEEAVAPGRTFYDLLAQHFGGLTPYYISSDQIFGPYTLEALHDPGRGHYGPVKNRMVAARLASLLQKAGLLLRVASDQSIQSISPSRPAIPAPPG